MAQLFHRSANNIAKISMILAVVVAGLAGYAYTQIARSSYLTNQYLERQQPVQFSHKHHSGDDGIDCRYCHTSVETSNTAGMPSTQTCMNCHNQLWADAPYLEPIRRSFRTNEPIQWERVHDLPEFAYFNHSIHVAKGIGCSSCHGDVSNMAAVYQAESLQMEWCLSCHRNPEKFVRPQSEITNTKWKGDEISPEERRQLFADYNIRGVDILTSCSTCHR